MLEPIFEADFKPCSYGFRPRRRAQDALAEIHCIVSPSRNYHWVFEADIKACFDETDHTAVVGRVRHRIGDKRILALVKAFLRAGILSEEGVSRETITGTPQVRHSLAILANIALSNLDEYFAAKWEALGPEWTRAKRRRAGEPVMRLVRYADDFVVMIHGLSMHTLGAPAPPRLEDPRCRRRNVSPLPHRCYAIPISGAKIPTPWAGDIA